MKMTVLMDNLAAADYLSEWGLAIYIEYGEKKFLLDTGASDAFAANAQRCAVDLSKVDYAVLSHAHFDHSDGMEAFFTLNQQAPMLLRPCKENCYANDTGEMEYVGIHPGWLARFHSRLQFIEGDHEICPGVKLLPHSLDMTEPGKRAMMYTLEGKEFFPELFKHEQSLVFETEKGLVIFNSCSHGGADNIIREVQLAYPQQKLYAMVGGFHLYNATPEEVAALADRIKATGIQQVVTGHCTGEAAYAILKEKLGDMVQQMYAGFTLTF